MTSKIYVMVSGNTFINFRKMLVAGFFFCCLLLAAACGRAQSFFLFEGGIAPAGPAASSAVFFNMAADGKATARITYTDSAAGTTVLVEQKLDTVSSFENGSIKRYMVAKDNGRLLRGNDMSACPLLRFLFEEQHDSLGSYFAPTAIDYQLAGNTWAAASIRNSKQASCETLQADKALLLKFYDDNDPFAAYLHTINSRGLDKTQLATRLYLIIVANTTDTAIGASSKIDMERMQLLFGDMTAKLGIKMIPVTLWDKSFNIRNVKKTIDTLRPRSSDIIVFYYTGHGFRYTDDQSKYARMSLRTSQTQPLELNNLSLENDVYKILLAKGARVTLVIGDCCNTYADAAPSNGGDLLRPRGTALAGMKLNFENCTKLFFGSEKVAVIISSAQKDQVSCCNPKLGGFFTNFLNEQLIKSLYGNDGEKSWLNILLKANENTSRQSLTAECSKTSNFRGRCVQKPEMYVWPLF